MPKLLSLKDFRARRQVLTDDDFGLSGQNLPPRDQIDQETWKALTTLPTDVAIRSSDHDGTRIRDLYLLCCSWQEAIEIPKDDGTWKPSMVWAPMLTASEELDAALFNVLHGFYRPAIGCCRNALEVVAVGSACEALQLDARFTEWQKGNEEFAFGDACDRLATCNRLGQLRKRLREKCNDSLFEQKTNKGSGGWLRRFHKQLSNYSHSRPGFTSGDLSKSNVPVYDPAAFRLCFDMQVETFAACYLLLKIAKADFKIGDAAKDILFKAHSAAWLTLATEAARELGRFSVD
jgi:hypothetical protein